MIYLLEGPDCGGKTTLLNTQFHDWGSVHHGAYPTANDAFTAYERLLESIAEKPRNLIIDRMHISERIYGQQYHGFCMSDHRYYYLEDLCQALKIEVILCQPSWEIVHKTWSSRLEDEMIKDETQIKKVYDAYADIGAYTSLITHKYDYSKPDALTTLYKSLLRK